MAFARFTNACAATISSAGAANAASGSQRARSSGAARAIPTNAHSRIAKAIGPNTPSWSLTNLPSLSSRKFSAPQFAFAAVWEIVAKSWVAFQTRLGVMARAITAAAARIAGRMSAARLGGCSRPSRPTPIRK